MSICKRNIPSGSRFGRLVVVKEAKSRNGKRFYLCNCDCGNKKEIRMDRLNVNGSKSCGCLQIEVASQTYTDLLGQKFGRLLITEKTVERKNPRNVVWKCLCDCGNIAYVDSKSLKTGNTKSCGCLHDERTKMMGYSNKGENNGQWKGGITTKQRLLRNCTKMKSWKYDVLKRDEYICQKCFKKGGELNVHHIINFSDLINKKELFDTSIGITLCKECHKRFHKTYGVKNNNYEQIEEFTNTIN